MADEKKEKEPSCKFGNPYIDCTNRSQCYKCGWNPQIAQQRLEQIVESLREQGKTIS